jgi:hypothetical protein
MFVNRWVFVRTTPFYCQAILVLFLGCSAFIHRMLILVHVDLVAYLRLY